MAVLGTLLILLTPFGLCPDELPSPASTQEMIASMIRSLDNTNLDEGRCTEEMCRLPRLAPTSIEAQQATFRYLERFTASSDGVPVYWARTLAQYDAAFAVKLTTLLKESQNVSLNQLCLVTLALMGKKASGQVQTLEAYIREVSDSVSRVRAQITLAIIAGTLDDVAAREIERGIRERDCIGLEAVQTATLVGLRSWATEGIVSEVTKWLESENVFDICSCYATVALAVSDNQNHRSEEITKCLLAASADDPDASTLRIYYAYALAWMDRNNVEAYWRIILRAVHREGDHTASHAVAKILVSIPLDHVVAIRRLCQDPDPDVKTAAAEISQGLSVLVDLGMAPVPAPTMMEAGENPVEKSP